MPSCTLLRFAFFVVRVRTRCRVFFIYRIGRHAIIQKVKATRRNSHSHPYRFQLVCFCVLPIDSLNRLVWLLCCCEPDLMNAAAFEPNQTREWALPPLSSETPLPPYLHLAAATAAPPACANKKTHGPKNDYYIRPKRADRPLTIPKKQRMQWENRGFRP